MISRMCDRILKRSRKNEEQKKTKVMKSRKVDLSLRSVTFGKTRLSSWNVSLHNQFALNSVSGYY